MKSPGNILTSPAAGTPLTVEMHQQPGDRACGSPAIGGNHYGPVMVYMAKVSDAKTADGSQASFFKVAEDGYTGTTASWGTEILNANCGKRAFTGMISVPHSSTSENPLLTIFSPCQHRTRKLPRPSRSNCPPRRRGTTTALRFVLPDKRHWWRLRQPSRRQVPWSLQDQRRPILDRNLRLQVQVHECGTRCLHWLSAPPQAGEMASRMRNEFAF